MEEMDDDGGGMIEYTEFLAWWIGKKRNGEDLFAAVQARALELKQQKKEDKAKRQEARDMFDLYDVDQGGMLDRDEVKALAEALGTKLRGREIDKAMAVMDEDGSGEVDFDEFFEWCTLPPPPPVRAPPCPLKPEMNAETAFGDRVYLDA
eukprot:SAG11_NODE_78_length_17939_cov_10.236883_9_plen_150_part_00